MTTTRVLADLFRAISAEDFSRASLLASELCKAEEKKGHVSAAKILRGALKGTGVSRGAHSENAHTQAASLLSTALVRLRSLENLDSIVLTSPMRAALQDVVAEWKFSNKLRERGLAARSKLLFHGPPGCGKSLTAQALGNALGLPVYMVRFDAVIGAFLGQTATNLRQLFHFAETTPCVLLLDELDALGKRRGNPLDVGELDRIVISLLQELEHAKPIGVVVATTNLAAHLDDALWRRFDLDIEFRPPSKTVMRSFVNKTAAAKKINLKPEVVAEALRSSNFAAAEKVVLAEVRRQVLAPFRRA